MKTCWFNVGIPGRLETYVGAAVSRVSRKGNQAISADVYYRNADSFGHQKWATHFEAVINSDAYQSISLSRYRRRRREQTLSEKKVAPL